MAKNKAAAKKTAKKAANKKTSSKKGSDKKVAKGTKKTYKRGALGAAVRVYFATLWNTKKGEWNELPDYETAKKVALKALPDSKFDRGHFGWYKNDFKNRMLG